MHNAYVVHRYRKYAKRLARKWDNRVSLLKWRYWQKLYGSHKSLWEL